MSVLPQGVASVRVLVVDDNADVLGALESRLRREPGLHLTGSLACADSLVETVKRLAPDVVLLDLDMPGREPLGALADLTREHPRTRVIILSGHVRRELIDRSVSAGAWGYLSKNDDFAGIAAAVRRVMEGEMVLSPEVQAALGT